MKEEVIERHGFILVCDVTDVSTANDIKSVIEKLQQIEKTNNLIYPKCIFINKMDRNQKKNLKTILTELEEIKKKCKLDIFKVSALTNSGVIDAFRKFMGRIHQQKVDEKQNEGMDDRENSEDEAEETYFTDKFDSCTRKVFCGSRMFQCSSGLEQDDEGDDR